VLEVGGRHHPLLVLIPGARTCQGFMASYRIFGNNCATILDHYVTHSRKTGTLNKIEASKVDTVIIVVGDQFF